LAEGQLVQTVDDPEHVAHSGEHAWQRLALAKEPDGQAAAHVPARVNRRPLEQAVQLDEVAEQAAQLDEQGWQTCDPLGA